MPVNGHEIIGIAYTNSLFSGFWEGRWRRVKESARVWQGTRRRGALAATCDSGEQPAD